MISLGMLFSFHDAVKCMILPQIYDVYDCKYNRAGRFAVLIDKMNRATVIKAQFQESFVQDGGVCLHPSLTGLRSYITPRLVSRARPHRQSRCATEGP